MVPKSLQHRSRKAKETQRDTKSRPRGAKSAGSNFYRNSMPGERGIWGSPVGAGASKKKTSGRRPEGIEKTMLPPQRRAKISRLEAEEGPLGPGVGGVAPAA